MEYYPTEFTIGKPLQRSNSSNVSYSQSSSAIINPFDNASSRVNSVLKPMQNEKIIAKSKSGQYSLDKNDSCSRMENVSYDYSNEFLERSTPKFHLPHVTFLEDRSNSSSSSSSSSSNEPSAQTSDYEKQQFNASTRSRTHRNPASSYRSIISQPFEQENNIMSKSKLTAIESARIHSLPSHTYNNNHRRNKPIEEFDQHSYSKGDKNASFKKYPKKRVINRSGSETAREMGEHARNGKGTTLSPLGMQVKPFTHSKSSLAFGRKSILTGQQFHPRKPGQTPEEISRNESTFSENKTPLEKLQQQQQQYSQHIPQEQLHYSDYADKKLAEINSTIDSLRNFNSEFSNTTNNHLPQQLQQISNSLQPFQQQHIMPLPNAPIIKRRSKSQFEGSISQNPISHPTRAAPITGQQARAPIMAFNGKTTQMIGIPLKQQLGLLAPSSSSQAIKRVGNKQQSIPIFSLQKRSNSSNSTLPSIDSSSCSSNGSRMGSLLSNNNTSSNTGTTTPAPMKKKKKSSQSRMLKQISRQILESFSTENVQNLIAANLYQEALQKSEENQLKITSAIEEQNKLLSKMLEDYDANPLAKAGMTADASFLTQQQSQSQLIEQASRNILLKKMMPREELKKYDRSHSNFIGMQARLRKYVSPGYPNPNATDLQSYIESMPTRISEEDEETPPIRRIQQLPFIPDQITLRNKFSKNQRQSPPIQDY